MGLQPCWGSSALQLVIPCWGEHLTITNLLHLSSECELLPSDSSLSGKGASSCPYPAIAAGRGLAGLWRSAGVRSWDLLTWGLTGALLCAGRRAVLAWLLTAPPCCCGGDHSITGPQNSWAWQGSREVLVQSSPPAPAGSLRASCPGEMWVSWI